MKYQPYHSCSCDYCKAKGVESWRFPRKRLNKKGLSKEEREARSARFAMSGPHKDHKIAAHHLLRQKERELIDTERYDDLDDLKVSTGYVM